MDAGTPMDAREYLDLLKDEKSFLRLAHYVDVECAGRGDAVIFDEEHRIAVMLQDCGPDIRAGDFVQYAEHPEAEPRIVGSPARFRG